MNENSEPPQEPPLESSKAQQRDAQRSNSNEPPNSLAGRLFSPRAMVIATLIGSLAAGVYMLYANYRTLGYPRLANRIAIVGWVFYALLIAATGLLPQGSLGWALLFGVGQAAIAFVAANALQGQAIAYHQQQGGTMHSSWTAVTVGLVAVLVLVILLVVMGAFGVGPEVGAGAAPSNA